jgi:hypothetical protein
VATPTPLIKFSDLDVNVAIFKRAIELKYGSFSCDKELSYSQSSLESVFLVSFTVQELYSTAGGPELCHQANRRCHNLIEFEWNGR